MIEHLCDIENDAAYAFGQVTLALKSRDVNRDCCNRASDALERIVERINLLIKDVVETPEEENN